MKDFLIKVGTLQLIIVGVFSIIVIPEIRQPGFLIGSYVFSCLLLLTFGEN